MMLPDRPGGLQSGAYLGKKGDECVEHGSRREAHESLPQDAAKSTLKLLGTGTVALEGGMRLKVYLVHMARTLPMLTDFKLL